MKKLFIVVLCLLFVNATFSQQIETRQVGSFQGIKSSQAIDVYLKKGNKEEVKVEVTNGRMRDGSYRKISVKVYVTYLKMEKIAASSASNVFSEGQIVTPFMSISASSAASIEISLDADITQVDASSAANVQLEGKSKRLEVEASSAGDIDAYELSSEIVDANASSGASVKVNVLKEIDGHASSGGSIKYRGTPSRTNTGSSSGGSVKKSN
jgi:hypothetical protein